MDTLLYVGLSHQTALRRRMDVTASNIANMDTAGYQRENVQFQNIVDEMEDAPIKEAGPVAFVMDFGVSRDTTPGDWMPTRNPFDAAIVGDAYFNVRSASGEVKYTRNGHFSLDGEGYVVVGGGQLLDSGGKPIKIEATDTDAHITDRGTIATSQREIATIGVTRFGNPGSLTRAGDTLLSATAQSLPENVTEPKLKAGMIEQSNIKPIVEMTEMITVQRAYEATSRMIDRIEDMRKRAIERSSRVQ